MKVAVGADHAGVKIKEDIIHVIKELGMEPIDLIY